MKAAMIIAHNGFRDEEYFIPRGILLENNIEVVTVSSSLAAAIGKFGGQADVDVLLSELSVDQFDAVVFVGGPGTVEYTENKVAHSVAEEAYKKGKLLCAICMAPVILANAGLLKGRKATVFSANDKDIKAKGAIYQNIPVVVDNNIITGCGPDAAEKFGRVIVEQLTSKVL